MELGELIARIGGDIKPLQDSLNQAKVELDRMDREVAGGMQQVNKSIKDVSKSMVDFGKKASLFITAPIVAAGGYAIKMASDYNESLNKVDVAFKGNSKEVKDWAKTTLQSFGIAEGSALDMAALFGDMATSMGFTTAQAAKMSTELSGLAGDLASFKNIDIEEAVTALNGVFTGETESLKRLGIVQTEANLSAFALSNGITKSYQQMSQAEKVALRYNYILSVTKNAQGDFHRTQEGAANQMRIFKESMKELSEKFGQIIIPAFTKLIKYINELVERFIGLSDGTKKVIIAIAGIAATIGPLLLIIGKLIMAFKSLSLLMKASPIGIIIAALSALAVSIIALVNIFGKAKKETATYNDVLNNLSESSKKFTENISKNEAEIISLFGALKRTNEGTRVRSSLIKTINEKYGEYLPNLITEKTSLDDINKVEKKLIGTMKSKMALKANEEKINAIIENQQKREAEYFKSYESNTAPLSAWIAAMEEYYSKNNTYSIINGKLVKEEMKNVLDLSNVTGFTFKQLSSVFNELKKYRDADNEAINESIALYSAYLNKITSGTIPEPVGKIGKISVEELPKISAEDTFLDPAIYEDAKAAMQSTAVFISETALETENFGFGIESVTTKISTFLTDGVNRMKVGFSEMRKIVINASEALEYLAEDVVVSLAESIGNAFAGGTFNQGWTDFLQTLANWASQVGKIMIVAGLSVKGFWETIKINPLAAVAWGAALVAAAAAVNMALSNPTTSSSSSSSSPTGSSSSVSGKRELLQFNVSLSGEFTAKGSDLALALSNENVRKSM